MNSPLACLSITLFASARIFAEEPQLQPNTHPAKLSIAPEDILSSREVSAGNRTVTIQSLKPLVLPPAATPQTPPATAIKEAEVAADQNVRLLVVGATIYHLPNPERSTRVLLRVWDQETKQNVTCWSSANWNWLSGASASFDGRGGRKYALVLSVGDGGDDSPAMPSSNPARRSSSRTDSRHRKLSPRFRPLTICSTIKANG